MNIRASKWIALGVSCLAITALAGCANWSKGTSAHSSSSLVEFLYPDGKALPREDALPELRVPLRVGLAFLPSRVGGTDTQLQAIHREQLLESIKKRFSEKKFVTEITLIPDYYLARKGGYEGLAGVQRLYNIDVMALVSYDQVTHNDDNDWSLGYITIVGAYILKGSRHDVSTLVDLAVIDPASRSLILRAGGTDTRHGTTTMIDDSRKTREARAASFDAATAQMVEHFDAALTKFETDVRDGKAQVRVVNRDGSPRRSGGGGALAWEWIAALFAVLALSRYSWTKRCAVIRA
jgi:rhombotail lipoprotein